MRGLLDLLTERQREIVLKGLESRIYARDWNTGSIKALVRDKLLREVDDGVYELTRAARNAAQAHVRRLR